MAETITVLDAHLVFDGGTNKLKAFTRDAHTGATEEKWEIDCWDHGIWDNQSGDPYSTYKKCPPGNYMVGVSQPCAIRIPGKEAAIRQNSDDDGYGCFFTPLSDISGDVQSGGMARHGRLGIGVHGGGTAAPNPYAFRQVIEPTLGCFRLYNQDNETIFVPFVHEIHAGGGRVIFSVSQPEGGS